MEDRCPRCGYSREPDVMQTHADKPGFLELWRGIGEDRLMVWTARVGSLVLLFLFLVEFIHLVS